MKRSNVTTFNVLTNLVDRRITARDHQIDDQFEARAQRFRIVVELGRPRCKFHVDPTFPRRDTLEVFAVGQGLHGSPHPTNPEYGPRGAFVACRKPEALIEVVIADLDVLQDADPDQEPGSGAVDFG